MALQSRFLATNSPEILARKVARAAGTFEHERMGRDPASVTVVAGGDWMVVSLQTTLAPLERIVAGTCRERARVIQDRQRASFHRLLPELRRYVSGLTGVELRGGTVSIDADTGSVIKTFATHPAVELFLMGKGLPVLGVPIDEHVHADGPHVLGAFGNHAVGRPREFRREPSVMTQL